MEYFGEGEGVYSDRPVSPSFLITLDPKVPLLLGNP